MEIRPADVAPAGFLRRAAAYLIDALIVTFLWALASFSATAISIAVDPEGEGSDFAVGMVLFFAGPVIWLFYQWTCNSKGVSIGKKGMSLAVRTSSEAARPGVGRGLLRTVGQALGALPLGLGFWWALWDAGKLAWHDKMAGTRVVRVSGEAAQTPTPAEARPPRWLPPWMRARYAKYVDPLALKKALEEPLPLDAASTPLDMPLWPGRREPFYALYLFGGIVPLVVFRFAIGFSPDLPTLLLIAGELLLAITSGIELSGLNRRIQVSGEGIRLVKIYGTRTIPWSQVERIEAKPDLLSMRAVGRTIRVSWDCRLVPLEKRKDIIIAIRARLPLGVPIQEWPKGGQRLSHAFRFVFSGAAIALFFTAAVMGGTAYGHALGLRCDTSSHYLRERFGLPQERGCVILHISGSAQCAGLRQGDMMIAMDGIPITSRRQFSVLFDESSKSRFAFTVLRPGSGEPVDFVVKLGPGSSSPEEDPSDPIFYYLRARSDSERSHIERHIEDYTRAIELAPDFDLAYLYRGELYLELGDRDAAERDYLRALELDPNLGAAHRSLSYLRLAYQDFEPARASIQKAIALDECEEGFTGNNIDCAEDLYLLAATCEYPDFAKGIESAERSIEFYSDFAEPYFQLAYFHHYMGDREEAQDWARCYLSFPESDRERSKSQQARDILASQGATE